MKKYLYLLSISSIVFLLLVYAFVNSDSHLSSDYQYTMKLIGMSKNSIAGLESDVLRSQSFLLLDYDSIASESRNTGDLCVSLKQMELDQRSASALTDYCSALGEELGLIENFKSRNAIFRNSVYYLQAMAGDELKSRSSLRAHEHLIRSLLLYLLFSSDSNRLRIEAQMKLSTPQEFGILYSHAKKAMALKGEIVTLVSRILAAPTKTKLEELSRTYSAEHDKKEASALLFRRVLFAVGIALLIFMIFNHIQIWSVSDQVRLANLDLLTQVDLVKKANEAKSLFLANISHELRTPMHAVLSFAQFGRKATIDTPLENMKDYFNEIFESGSRLMYLLNDLLDLSKLEANRMTYLIEEADMISIFDAVRSELAILADSKAITFSIKNESQSADLRCDKFRISQVIRNLISNAIKFSDRGSAVELSLKKGLGGLRVSVTNKGIGIPKNELEVIFDKFAQSSKTRSGAGGTGLGLAISKEIITHHGGTIWAESEPDGTTRFSFELPNKPNETESVIAS